MDNRIILRKLRQLIQHEIDRLENDEVEFFDSVLRFREIEEKLDIIFGTQPIVIGLKF